MIVNSLVGFASGDLISGLANISQLITLPNSIKAADLNSINNALLQQTNQLIEVTDLQTQEVISEFITLMQENNKQNKLIIEQNNQIIKLLGGKEYDY